ncbi:MAG: hypothetical protein U0470_08345 [Anaerolineae bacterium]
MRSTAVLVPKDRPTLRRPITGARAAIWLSAGALGIALGLNLGLPLPHPDRTSRGMAQVNEASVGVVLFPDLSGVGDFGADCAGCDGLFESGDLLFAQRDPLPRLDVTLADALGSSLTMRTRTLVPGRQSTLFRVDAPGAFTVTLPALPPAGSSAERHPAPSGRRLPTSTRRRSAPTSIIAVAHGCRRADATATVTVTEDRFPRPPPSPPTPRRPDATSAAAATDVSDLPDGRPTPGGSGRRRTGRRRRTSRTRTSPLAPAADASLALRRGRPDRGAPSQTGLAGRSPLGRPIGLALLAVVAAALGEGGRRLHLRRPAALGLAPARAR